MERCPCGGTDASLKLKRVGKGRVWVTTAMLLLAIPVFRGAVCRTNGACSAPGDLAQGRSTLACLWDSAGALHRSWQRFHVAPYRAGVGRSENPAHLLRRCAADADRGLLVLDGTWRWVEPMERLTASVPVRSLPPLVTAYPRSSKVKDDPEGGLATIEAIYAAYRLLGRDTTALLDHYHWGEQFVELNQSFWPAHR